MVLRILSQIWKTGATIKRLENGELELKVKNPIPDDIMRQATDRFAEIDEWHKSVEGSSAVEQTMFKVYSLFCGWQHNEVINKWLCSDLESLDKVDRWIKSLERNGMKDIYEDFRQFQSEESDKLANELYKSAIAYVRGQKGN